MGDSVPYPGVSGEAGPAGPGDLQAFRARFYDCLPARADELFELTDAVLCSPGPVTTLVDLSLCPEHRRGHGALYDGLSSGAIETIGSAVRDRRVEPATRHRRSDHAGRRCQPVAAARRAEQRGTAVLPHPRPRQESGADDPGLAVLRHRRVGTGSHLMDGGTGHGAPDTGRRRHHRHRRHNSMPLPSGNRSSSTATSGEAPVDGCRVGTVRVQDLHPLRGERHHVTMGIGRAGEHLRPRLLLGRGRRFAHRDDCRWVLDTFVTRVHRVIPAGRVPLHTPYR